MSRGARLGIFGAGALLLLGCVLWGMTGMHDFGHFAGDYGRILASSTVEERHVTNAVVATAFDYRAFDTLGEELILFVAAAASVLLLRTERDEEEAEQAQEAAQEHEPRTSEGVRWIGGALTGPVVLLGLYIVTHGHLSPGGGFQGGVIIAAAAVLLLAGGRVLVATHLRGLSVLEALEALGAAGFAFIGLGGLVASLAFLDNFIPLGPYGLLNSGGMIPLLNVSVGLEVAGAFLVIAAELADARFLSRGPDE
jgi:multicomponent Na+:H+ antiporter subunit B